MPSLPSYLLSKRQRKQNWSKAGHTKRHCRLPFKGQQVKRKTKGIEVVAASSKNQMIYVCSQIWTQKHQHKMAEDSNLRYRKRKQTIEGALEVLGPQAREIILAYLLHQKKIIIGNDYCSPIAEIEASLRELLGGTTLIVHSIVTRGRGAN